MQHRLMMKIAAGKGPPTEVPTGRSGELTCFEQLDVIQATDAIRITMLL
jgi:hypothetical protein